MDANGHNAYGQDVPLLGAAATVRRFKAASNINVKDFDSEKDEFERWIIRFEKAVKLATNMRDGDAPLHNTYKDWLPLKLDEDALSHLENLDIEVLDWNTLKERLAELLIDPGERLRWQTHQTTIKWDGKEPLHMLATRIIRGVNKYHKTYPQEVKEAEYFARFRNAFDPSLMCIIDMNCPAGSQTIDIARDALTRFHLTPKKPVAEGDSYQSFVSPGAPSPPDAVPSLESSLATITEQMGNIALNMRTMRRDMEDRFQDIEDRLQALEEAQYDDYC